MAGKQTEGSGAPSALVVAPSDEGVVDSCAMTGRKQFARFMSRVGREGDQRSFSSSLLYVESVLAKAKAQLPESQDSQAAVALWALNVLGRDSPVLARIGQLITPTIFDDYSIGRCTAGVPSGLRALLGGNDPILLESCPSLSHNYYFESGSSMNEELRDALGRAHALENMSDGKLRAARRMIDSSSRALLRTHFLAWRHSHRKERIARFTARIHAKRLIQHTRLQRMGLAFANWRWAVEHGRSLYLQERLHDNAYLLDNAKNQFQMQCFRSDRYLHTVEELRHDLQGMRENRDAFRGEARALEKALRDHRIISRDEKNDIANTLLRSLSEWKHTATVSVTRRLVPRQLMQLEASASAMRAKRGLPIVSATATLHGALDEAMDDDTRTNAVAEHTCLEWANNLLHGSPIASGRLLTNYGEDFADGEALLLLMKETFPDSIPLTPLQEPNLMRRLDKIADLASLVGLSHFPLPTDLAEKASDIVFMAIAELFMHHTRGLLSAIPSVSEPPQCLIRYDAGMVKSALRDVAGGMDHLLASERGIADDLAKVSQMVTTVSNYASFLTRERLAGHPVALVDQREVNRFCRFKPGRFRDLEFKYKRDSAMEWGEQMNRLRDVIRKAFPLIKRCFEGYAGVSSCVAEPNFWRFISDLGIVDKQTPRAAVERIFIVANREDDAVQEGGYSDEEDADNPLTELIPIEFTECVIRIADQRMQGRTIHERVNAFINTSVKSLGARRSDTSRFRRDIYDRSTQPIWAKYQKDLAKVFVYFARHSTIRGASSQRQSKLITLQDLLVICRDGGVLQGGLDDNIVFLIGRSVVGDDVNEVPLHAFMECLAALAVFRVPNPFIPLGKKVDYIVSQLLATLRVKLRGVVTVGDVKLVPMPTLK